MALAGSATLQAGMGSVFIMIVSLVIVVLMITWLKINPVYSMLVGAIGAGIAFGLPLSNVILRPAITEVVGHLPDGTEVIGTIPAVVQHGVIQTVVQGFGATIGNIGIVILLGCTIGVILDQTGGALVLANSMLRLVGPRNASLAMMFSGYLVSIPVFSDTAIVIMAPVARTVSARSGAPLIACLGALNAGIMATHTIVPPTPGPLAAAGTLGVDLGRMIILGLLVALAYSVVAWIWCATFCAKKFPRAEVMEGIEPLPKGKKLTAEDLMIKTDRRLPSTFMAYASLLVPILLICLNSFGTISIGGRPPLIPAHWHAFSGFIGHPIVALGIGVLVAFGLDPSALSKEQIGKWFNKSVDTSAFIILATGTAGSYGFILRVSGVGEFMGHGIANTGLPVVFIPFFVTLLLVLSNGSATVSLITGSAIMYPLLPFLGLPPVIVALALTAGASFFYHVNASHYWVVVRSANLSMKEGFFNVSGGTAIGSIGAMICVFILSLFVTV